METRCRVTPGEGDLRESATESKPPRSGSNIDCGVRVKGWGKSPPRGRQRTRHGKPHREQNRIGITWALPRLVSRPVVRVGCERCSATGTQDEWLSRLLVRQQAIQNPAYRPTGIFHLVWFRESAPRSIRPRSNCDVYSALYCGALCRYSP